MSATTFKRWSPATKRTFEEAISRLERALQNTGPDPKKANVANLATSIRIEVSKVNGKTVTDEFSDSDLWNLWETGLGKSINDVAGFSNFRMPTGVFRLVYRLKAPVSLATFVTDPFFIYNKTLPGGTNAYSCKILDLNSITPAEIGNEVQVFVYYTHNEVSLAQIDKWMAMYGTLTSDSSFGLAGMFENKAYTVTIKLKYFIPEYLPIWGKRARIYYHGMPRFCNRCFTIGHSKPGCGNTLVTWKAYIERLRQSGIRQEYFGNWLAVNVRDTQPILTNVAQPSFTPKPIDENFLKRELVKFLQEIFLTHEDESSTPSASASGSGLRDNRVNSQATGTSLTTYPQSGAAFKFGHPAPVGFSFGSL